MHSWGRMRLTDYGMYGYALACAESMRSACELAVRYHALATPVMRIAFEVEHDVASWVLPTLDEAALPTSIPICFARCWSCSSARTSALRST